MNINKLKPVLKSLYDYLYQYQPAGLDDMEHQSAGFLVEVGAQLERVEADHLEHIHRHIHPRNIPHSGFLGFDYDFDLKEEVVELEYGEIGCLWPLLTLQHPYCPSFLSVPSSLPSPTISDVLPLVFVGACL